MRKLYFNVVLVLSFFILNVFALQSRAQLSGSYTINPSQPTGGSNFRHFSEVLSALNLVGVNGATTFNIASGVYDTLLTFPATIPGMGATAPIIFQSATGNAPDVTLRNTSAATATNYVIDLNGAKHMTFRNLTFETLGTTYGNCVVLRNNSSNILIERNSIKGVSTSSTSTNMALIFNNASSIDSNIVIRNNTFLNGSYSIYLYGTSATDLENGNIIEGNTISNFYISGIFTYYQKNILISKNELTTNTTYASTVCMSTNYSDYSIIHGNNISQPTYYGLYLNRCDGDATTQGLIYNNFISIRGSSTALGINNYYSNYNNFYHNSINCYNTSIPAGRAFSSEYSNNFILKNNNFSNIGGGHAFYTNTATFESDYNNLYSNGSNICYYNSVNIPNIGTWISTTHKDSNSVSTNPNFFYPTDLHTFNAATSNNGTFVGVLDDFDGENRSLTTPDIGADEYTIPNENAGVSEIAEPLSQLGLVVGTSHDIKVKIVNTGLVDLTKVTIEWALNGITQGTPFEWTGLLPVNSTSSEITIGSMTFNNLGYNTISAWTKMPNDSIDLYPQNDTASKLYIVCANVIAGTYTIDPSLPAGGTNFQHFSDVLAILSQCGVSDTTVFNIANGIYDTLLTFPATIPGMGANAPITFQSASGNAADVKLLHTASSTANNYIIDVNGAKFMTFRNLTFETLGTTYGNCVVLRNNSSNILLEGNSFKGVSTSTTSTNMALIFNNASSIDSNIVIRNNTFLYGSNSIFMSGSSSTLLENGNIVEDNIMSNFYNSGINCSYQKNINIANNTLSTNSAYASTTGMYLYYCDFSLLEKNRVSQPRYYGINLYYCDGNATTPGFITNNFITVGGTSTAYGLYLNSSAYYNIFHNSINCTSTSTSLGRSVFFNGGSNVNLSNNIFANTGGGYAFYASSTSFTSDYNNLFTTGTYLGYYSVNIPDLTIWTGLSLQDNNSVSMNPNFASSSDLHTHYVSMNNLGAPIGILDDIDGESRNLATPDLGADEYTPPTADAGVVGIIEPVISTIPVVGTPYIAKVRIKNFGAAILTKASIEWTIDGVAQPPFAWTGNLLPDSVSTEIPIGTAIFTSHGNSTISAWTMIPNDSIDPYPTNDTATNNYFACNMILAGTYTIDPSVPTGGSNFQYFSDVLSILNQCGVSDTTIFSIANGVYDTLLTFPDTIPGMGANAPITFQSASGNAADVKLLHTASSTANNYIIDVNGAKFMTFRNLTFETLGTTYGNCVVLRNNSSNILIEGNIIKGPTTSSTSSSMALIFNFSSSIDSNIVIRNNTFLNGSISILMSGSSATLLENGNIIEDNIMSNFYNSGINCSNQKNINIANNTLSTNTAYTSTTGIYLYYCDFSRIEKNRVSQPRYYGINLNYCDGNATTPGFITNNFITVGGTSNAYGLYLYNSAYYNLFHNSINCTSTSTSNGRAVYYYGSNNFNFKNNIFANTGGGYAFYTSTTSFTSDYNNLFTTGTNLGYYSANITNLTAWTTASLQDNNSVSMNPNFTSPTDLHFRTDVNNNLGTPIGIADDIDGEIRSLTTPDIGADEYTPPAEDAGVVAIIAPLNTPIPETGIHYATKVIIKNFGTDTLEKATVNWEINGVAQPSYLWTGSLLRDSISGEILIDSTVFIDPGNNYIKVWTDLPNDSMDGYNSNDTTIETYIVCRPPLAGSYTIDPLSPLSGTNFQYFADVLYTLNNCGLGDTTVFNIATGVYDTLLTFPATIPGMGSTAPVTFQSATGNAADVTLKHNGSSTTNYIIDINGAKHMTFRNLTVEALGTSYGIAVALRNSSNNILIEGNIIKGQNTTSTNSLVSLIYNYGASIDSNIVIRNNTLLNSSYSIYMSGSSTTSYENGNVIENNTLNNYYCNGLLLSYQKDIAVRNNQLSTNTNYSSAVGINLDRCYSPEIDKNSISQPKYYGIYLLNCNGDTTTQGLISNNFISIGTTTTAYGIHAYFSNYFNIFNNSINCTSTGDGRAINYYSSYNFNIKNNIFANTGGGYAFYTNNTNFASDYNDLYTSGANLGYFTTTRATLSDWTTATMKDSNSVSSNPLFSSPTNLHAVNVTINNAGTPVGIIDDIDGETRSLTTPDIGADEFTPLTENAGVLVITEPFSAPSPIVGVTYTTKVKIFNAGADTLKKATIAWAINGVVQIPFAWTGTLLPDSISAEITIGTVVFALHGNNTITAWTELPNDSIDPYPLNDTARKQFIVCNQILAGIYTIDSANPTGGTNFHSFTDVMFELNYCGVSDTTVFNIASGVYDTLLTFSATIPGMGATAPITFQSATGNAADVTLSHNSTSIGNYIIDLNGAKFMTFRNLTLDALSSSYGTCVALRNNSNNISIEGNIIKGQAVNSISTNLALIFNIASSIDSNIVIKHNTLLNGSYSIYMCGNTAALLENRNIIENNSLINYYHYGLYLTYQKYINITNNTLSTNSTYASTTGMYLNYCDFSLIDKNKITQPRYYGINLNFCHGDATTRGIISNNFITVGGTATAYGLYFSYTNYYNIFHNSINCTSTNTSTGRAMQYNNSNNCNFLNNIFSNTGGGYAFYTSTSALTSDYNNLFTTGTYLGYFSGDRTNLAAWSAASSQDNNSVSMNPNFVSSTDLHTRYVPMNDLGIPVGILEDIDGEIRSLTTPDIGADEYTPPTEDAGVVEITDPISITTSVVGTPYNTKVKIKNFGSNTLTKATIEWTINGIAQTPFAWTGSLLPDSVSGEIAIGVATFTASGNNIISAWTVLPNDSIDPFSDNDTTTNNYLACNVVFAGTYTINPAAPTTGTNFRYFAEVMSILNTCGVMDTTVFNIASGTYDTLLTFPATIPGMGESAPITFQSATGIASNVTLRHSNSSTANYIIDLNGAKYITFRNMTLQATGTSYGTCIAIRGGSKNILIENNTILGPVTTSTSANMALINNYGTSIDSIIVIRNNSITNGSFGIYLYGVNSSLLENNNIIENNSFSGYYVAGIQSFNQNGVTITNNSLTTNSAYSSTIGIYLSYNDYCKISKNTISQPSYYGIYLNYCNGNTTNLGEISNNFIITGGTATSYGLYVYSTNFFSIFHNSINCNSTNTSSGRALYYNNSNNCDFKNNIFANSGGGYAFYSTSTSFTSDFNNLFSTGSNLGYYNNINQTNLTSWIAATLRDNNSFSVNPDFTSSTDLHTSRLTLNNTGTPVGITDDIDGEIRSATTPDIGADEFKPFTENTGVVIITEPFSTPIPLVGTGYNTKVKIKNFGSNILTKATIKWTLNGVAQTPYYWTGTLQPDSTSQDIAIGTTTFPTPGNFTITAWTETPNDSIDPYPENDTASKIFYVCTMVLAGTYTIDPAVPTGGTNFQHFSNVMNTLTTCGVSDTTVFNIASGIYDTLLTFPATIPGMGANAPITFQSASGNAADVTLRHFGSATDNYVIDVNGAKYMSFRNITIQSLGSTYGTCLSLRNNSKNILIENNIISGPITVTTSTNMALIYNIGSSIDSNIVIRNNQFLNGAYGIYFDGSSATELENSNIIEGNSFNNYFSTGLYARYQNKLVIRENTLSSNSTFSSCTGINLSFCDYSKIFKNKIIQPSYYGIYLYYCDADASTPGEISNNFIYVGGTTINAYGLYINYSSFFNVYHNSINTTSISIGRSLNYSSSSNFNFKNNIFANTGGGYAFYASSTSFTSDYNNLYSSGAVLAYYNGINQANLSNWTTASNQDHSSMSMNPPFLSATDLHLDDDIAFNNTGTPVGVLNDIDGDIRSLTTPDMGADEFNPILFDVGVLSILQPEYIQTENSNIYVIVEIKNFGTQIVNSIPIQYIHNSSPMQVFNWTGTLNPNGVVSVILPIITVGTGLNNICINTALLTDSTSFNDTLCVEFYGLPNHILYQDNMESNSQWTTNNPNLWQHGIPTASVINTSHSPDSVWTTVLDGDYPVSASGYLISPTINLIGISEAYLSFYYWLDTEDGLDGSFIQYSTNNGVTWNYLGSTITPYFSHNWFDSNFSGHMGWSQSTSGWTPAIISLEEVVGSSLLRLRFGFSSNSAINFNGMAIDDMKIHTQKANRDAGVVEIVSPASATEANLQISIQVNLHNFGSDTLFSIPVAYKLNTSITPQVETWTGTLAPDSTTTFAFSQTYLGPEEEYSLCSFTLLSGDPYKDNDTTCVDLTLVGIEDITQNGVVLMQNTPNPTSAQTEISFTLPESDNCFITLRNTLGEQILSTQLSGQTGKNTFNFDASNLEQGIYFYTLEYKDVVLTRRLSVIR